MTAILGESAMSVSLSLLSSGHADLCLQRQHVVRPHIDQGLKFGFHGGDPLFLFSSPIGSLLMLGCIAVLVYFARKPAS